MDGSRPSRFVYGERVVHQPPLTRSHLRWPPTDSAVLGRDEPRLRRRQKINGRKRHLVVDTRGLPLMVMVTPADLHHSAAAKEVLFRLRLMHPEITLLWADRAYAGKLVTWAKRHMNLTIKTVSRPKDTSGFVVRPDAGSLNEAWPG